MGNAEAKKKKKQQEQLKKLEQNEKKIGVAVYFLGGENMEKIPQTEKRIFLRKKGLTQQMVNEAFKRFQAKQKAKQSNPSDSKEAVNNQPAQNGQKKNQKQNVPNSTEGKSK